MSNSRTNVDILNELVIAFGGTNVAALAALLADGADIAGLFNSGNTGIVNAGGVRFANSSVTDDQTLDYYKEDVWTPSLTFGGTDVGMTYAVRTGRFIRIGKLAWVRAEITLTAKGSSVGSATVAGLPFSAVSQTPLAGLASAGFAALGNPLQGYLSGNVLVCTVGTATGNTQLDDTNFTNTSSFVMNGTIEVA